MHSLTLNALVTDEFRIFLNYFCGLLLMLLLTLSFVFFLFFCSLTCSKPLVLKVQILVKFSYESFFANFFLDPVCGALSVH